LRVGPHMYVAIHTHKVSLTRDSESRVGVCVLNVGVLGIWGRMGSCLDSWCSLSLTTNNVKHHLASSASNKKSRGTKMGSPSLNKIVSGPSLVFRYPDLFMQVYVAVGTRGSLYVHIPKAT
jgi:hypothetical protein